ncbi:MAG: hypothetical protein OER12_01840 [Acidimicrobiia bacterium]|nr:hypothetical protein [Acidimicrobiia bacterium]
MDFRELEETLCRLPAVDAVRIVHDRDQITEVHVLASPTKPAKQVVRDVQSLAMARFGVGIDRRAVSVVQLGDDKKGAEAERPIITSIKEYPEGPSTTVTVTLTWNGEQFSGSADGPAATSARLRIIGEATLRALVEVLGGGPPLALDAVATTSVGVRPVVVAQVVSMRGVDEEVAVGSALVRGDEAEAVVRAVLDALNRRIPALMR